MESATRFMRLSMIRHIAMLAVLLGWAAVSIANPVYQETVLFQSGVGGYHTYRIPSLAVMSNGTLLVFAEGRKSSGADNGDIDLVMRRSVDGGQTWSDMQVVYEEGGTSPITIGNPTTVVDQTNGHLHLLFSRNNERLFVTTSSDNGQTFLTPTEITKVVEKVNYDWTRLGPGPTSGIQMTSGRLVAPIWINGIKGNLDTYRSGALVSDDHGQTWQAGQVVPISADPTIRGTNECAVVQLADSSLLMTERTTAGTPSRATSTSTDGGITWTAAVRDSSINPQMTTIKTSIARYSLASTDGTNRLLYSAPGAADRSHMTVWLSENEAATWPIHREIYSGPSGYSELGVTADKTILLAYENGTRNYRKRITLAKFNLEWLQQPTSDNAVVNSNSNATPKAPDGLAVEFLRGPAVRYVADREPEFCWIPHSSQRGDVQVAYQILVATSNTRLGKNQGDLWDSGKVDSPTSINISYSGAALAPGQTYFWKVKTWCKSTGESPWSKVQQFTMASNLDGYLTSRYPICQSEIAPRKITRVGPGHYFVDFGKAAFGYLKLNLPRPTTPMEVHFGERADNNRVNKKPGGSVRYYRVMLEPDSWSKDAKSVDVHPPKDRRNTGPKAIAIPAQVGTVAPFRCVELIGGPERLSMEMIRQVAVHYPFNEEAACFQSSCSTLDDVWDLCKYTMKATSFAGVYVDGDRERIPYEADSYINQLSHYAVDRDYSLARYSHEYLLRHPTWPTEWKQHSVLMAWADYMYTGDKESLAENYNLLKSEKTLEQYARSDGLLDTSKLRDIVDWPKGERDNYDFRKVNTVVNAFYYRTLVQMADMAGAIGRKEDAAKYRRKAVKVRTAFNDVLFDERRGVYVDGEGSHHASLHANMMPLAFDLVPKDRVDRVADYVVSRGMACSVYGTQYLLEALYHAGRDEVALEYMTSKGLRSWYNMLRAGSTVTMEAWDNRFKPNQDWNHAWGAAPANIISRFVLGVRPLEPGFRKVLIRPQPGLLRQASGTVPTIRGPVEVSYKNEPGRPFILRVNVPVNVTACVGLPHTGRGSTRITLDGHERKGRIEKGYVFIDGIGSGEHVLTGGE